MRSFSKFRSDLISCRLNKEQVDSLQASLGVCLEELKEGIDELIELKSKSKEEE